MSKAHRDDSSVPRAEEGSKASVIDEIARATPRQDAASTGAASSATATCLRPHSGTRPGRCYVQFEDNRGELREQWIAHLDGLALAAGDQLLVTWLRGASDPVVVGRLAREEAAPAAAIPLPGGQRLVIDEAERGSAVRLELGDGRVALELDFSGETPTVRLPEQDLTLDLDGRLKIAARSIDLVSKLGNVNVKANDDFKVNAERIWLN